MFPGEQAKPEERTLRQVLEEQYGSSVVQTFPFAEGVDPDETITMPDPEALEEWEKNFLEPRTPPWSAA